jgi:hypothetical protein
MTSGPTFSGHQAVDRQGNRAGQLPQAHAAPTPSLLPAEPTFGHAFARARLRNNNLAAPARIAGPRPGNRRVSSDHRIRCSATVAARAGASRSMFASSTGDTPSDMAACHPDVLRTRCIGRPPPTGSGGGWILIRRWDQPTLITWRCCRHHHQAGRLECACRPGCLVASGLRC